MARRTFFSFHYQADIFRVNVVRNSPLTQNYNSQDSFFDASLWEQSKRSSDDSLKKLIREGMANCSVVCVLAGQHTWQRRWVRYEIARSIIDQKGLVCIHISGINDALSRSATMRGKNPIAELGICFDKDRNGLRLCEIENGQWIWFKDYTATVNVPKYMDKLNFRTVQSLATGTREYDYTQQNGYRNLSGWIDDAALAVGR